jgi:hypothetical protein
MSRLVSAAGQPAAGSRGVAAQLGTAQRGLADVIELARRDGQLEDRVVVEPDGTEAPQSSSVIR